MKTFIKEYWPVISAIGIYWVTIVILLITHLTQWYIHKYAIAGNALIDLF